MTRPQIQVGKRYVILQFMKEPKQYFVWCDGNKNNRPVEAGCRGNILLPFYQLLNLNPTVYGVWSNPFSNMLWVASEPYSFTGPICNSAT